MHRDQLANRCGRLAEYRARLPEVEGRYRFPAYTMRFGLMYEEAVARWFALLEAERLL